MVNPKIIKFIDPSSRAYFEDRLFDRKNLQLNRDDSLEPFIRLREEQNSKGIELHTSDYLVNNDKLTSICDYYSFGANKEYENLIRTGKVNLKAYIILEPPVVSQRRYLDLPKLTKLYERVYIFNTIGDGYSLKGVDQSKLFQVYYPQPRPDVIDEFWKRRGRQNRIVIINANHKPKSFKSELYSKRIEAMVELARFNDIDLYGFGWQRRFSRAALWSPVRRNRKTIQSIYKGTCASKYEVMSHYNFALCFENMEMHGYLTEKIFDCFYAGTIPLYWGAKNISELIPQDAFIDCRRFKTWTHMRDEILKMSEEKIQAMRLAGRTFIQSEQGVRYYNSLIDIVNA